ncbi:Bacterial regulatory helix-turn-helix protein, lysR family [Pseudomonas sp. 25 R 14]|nr:Bacterial regulatory helix-turn-helix protein, lysR family [Pseudomonas sp. 25 R 14]
MRNIVASSMQLIREAGQLEDLFYFACVAEFGSFSAASRELGVSKSLLSRHVDALEKNWMCD